MVGCFTPPTGSGCRYHKFTARKQTRLLVRGAVHHGLIVRRLANDGIPVLQALLAICRLCSSGCAMATCPCLGEGPVSRYSSVAEAVLLWLSFRKTKEGELDLERFSDSTSILQEPATWIRVLDALEQHEMPPHDATQPGDKLREQLIAGVRDTLLPYAHEHAGDPGPVAMRRLSNFEYDRTIAALTGVDLGLAQTFPSDAAGGEGFANAGSGLFVSPEMLERYVGAARTVAQHVVLLPSGIRFAQKPVHVQEDAVLDQVHKIMRFYRRYTGEDNTIDPAPYFSLLWQYRHREQLGIVDLTLADLAVAENLSPTYCQSIWQRLHDESPGERFESLRKLWQAVPPPESDSTPPPRELDALTKFVNEQHDEFRLVKFQGGGNHFGWFMRPLRS